MRSGAADRQSRPGRRSAPSPGVDDLAVLHAGDALGGGGDVVVVGDHQDRLAALVEAAEQLDHLVAALGVEGAGGLVGEQERRLVGEGPGDGEALALAAGERARAPPWPCRTARAGRAGRGRGSRPACA